MTSFVVNVVFAAMVQLLGSGQGNKAFISADQSLVCLSLVLRSLGEDDELDFRMARQRQDIHCGGSLGSVGLVVCGVVDWRTLARCGGGKKEISEMVKAHY